MASYGLYTLLTATGTATGTELTTGNNDQRTFQAVCTGTGAVTATVTLEGSLDKSNWVTITTLSISGTAPQTLSYEHTSAWTYIRARTSGVTGTGATVNVYVALNRKREERISETTELVVNATDLGVVADGSVDDTAALQAAITAAAGGTLVLPDSPIKVTSPITYDTAALGPLRVVGQGANSEVRIHGTAARAFEFTGTAGTTISHLQLESFRIANNHDTTATDGILLNGLAVYSLFNISVHGNNKMTSGIRLRGTQQGQISGGFLFSMTDGIVLEQSGAIASNGCDMHGVSFFATARNVVLDATDSAFVTNCHMVGAPIGVDIPNGGFGPPVIANCHIESHTTAGVRSAATVRILNTNFFRGALGTDISLTGGAGSLISGNLLQGNVTIGASATDTRYVNNYCTGTGTYSNSGTRTIVYGNVGTSGPVSNVGVLHDSLSLTSKAGSAGEILTANANGSISGSWGIGINGAGAGQDVYVKFHNAILAGSTSGGALRMKDAVGGNLWAAFGAFGIELPEQTDPAAPASNLARLFVRDNGSGKTQLCVRFPTGAIQVISTEP